ncbi:MAG: cyclase family protein [Anaerolineae bacterium]
MPIIHDISLIISPSLPVWPGDPAVQMSQPVSLERGDVCTVTRLDISAHTGTHVDAPAHFVPGGAGVDSLDLNVLIGPAWVTAVPDVPAITAEVLASLAIPAGTTRLLCKTRNSERWARKETTFATDFVAITSDGADWLLAHGIRLVGVDYLSVSPFHDTIPTHEILLGAGVIPLEGLNLTAVSPGAYDLVCLPLKLAGADGAPARAVLIERGS